MNSSTDFKTCRIAAGQVVYAQLLFHSTCRENLRVGLVGECDRTDNVVVGEGVQSFAGMGIPNFAVNC